MDEQNKNKISQEEFAETAPSKAKSKTAERVTNICLVAVIVLLLVLIVVRTFFVCTVHVEQTSMTPTIQEGSSVRVSRQAEVKRGDIVVFYEQDLSFFRKFLSNFGNEKSSSKKLIKRVVAVGGDSIWVEKSGDGYVLMIQDASGNVFGESYEGFTDIPLMYKDVQVVEGKSVHTTLGILANTGENNKLKLEEDTFFAMGDNRYNSIDSRVFGAVKKSQIFGVVKSVNTKTK